MIAMEWILELALLVALIGAIPFALRLERALAGLRRDRGAFEGGGKEFAKEFADAARLAEGAVQRLRASAEQAGRQVSERVAVAEPLRDDLRYLVERAETLADRLDGLVRAARHDASASCALRDGGYGRARFRESRGTVARHALARRYAGGVAGRDRRSGARVSAASRTGPGVGPDGGPDFSNGPAFATGRAAQCAGGSRA